MEAECNDTGRAKPFEYNQLIWGDLIYGTKDELQAIGLGIGMAFPGEPNGPKRLLNVRDPRGFATKIDRAYDGIRYCASIPFPDRSWPEPRWVEVAPGLKKCESVWSDEFIGSPEALAAAGLVRVDQLPGQPGMRKVTVTIFPDGTVAGGVPNASHPEARMPGAKSIQRKTKTTYCVSVFLSKDECEKRKDAYRRAERDYELRMQALQRPIPLIAPPRRGLHTRPGEAETQTLVENARARQVLFYMVDSADEYRQKMIKRLQDHVGRLRDDDMLPNNNHGFSLDESVAEELDSLLAEMIELITHADVRFNARRHEEINIKSKVVIAKGDASFQRTLDHLKQSVQSR